MLRDDEFRFVVVITTIGIRWVVKRLIRVEHDATTTRLLDCIYARYFRNALLSVVMTLHLKYAKRELYIFIPELS